MRFPSPGRKVLLLEEEVLPWITWEFKENCILGNLSPGRKRSFCSMTDTLSTMMSCSISWVMTAHSVSQRETRIYQWRKPIAHPICHFWVIYTWIVSSSTDLQPPSGMGQVQLFKQHAATLNHARKWGDFSLLSICKGILERQLKLLCIPTILSPWWERINRKIYQGIFSVQAYLICLFYDHQNKSPRCKLHRKSNIYVSAQFL